MSKACLTVAALLFVISAQAQRLQIGFDLSPAVGVGNLSAPIHEGGYGSKYGYGGKVFLQVFVVENLSIGVKGGYQTFPFDLTFYSHETKETEPLKGDQRIIPLEGFMTIYRPLGEKWKLMTGFSAGYYLFNSDNAGHSSYFFIVREFNGEDFNSFAVSGFLGAEYELTPRLMLRLNLAIPYLMTPEKGKSTTTVSPGEVTTETVGMDPPDFSYLELNIGLAFTLF